MKRKTLFGLTSTLLLVSISILAFDIQPVEASGTIYIRADGSIDPITAPIQREGNLYTFADNIYDEIVIERSHIVVDGNNCKLEGSGSGRGFSIFNLSNVIIQNMNIENFSQGVYIYFSYASFILNSTLTNNGMGLSLWSSGDTLSNNILMNNDYGIHMYWSFDNTLWGNTIANNSRGILLQYSSENILFHNNLNNTIQARTYESYNNIWDSGYPSGGNCWMDYTDEDTHSGPLQDRPGSDGIWDNRYVIDANNRDNYPLVEPWSSELQSPSEALEELIKTIDTWNLPKGTENSISFKLKGAIHLLDMGNENGAVHKLMNFMNQVEALRGKKLGEEQANYLMADAQRIIDLIEG